MEASIHQTISLRGHHLICLQFLHGAGYSPEFARHTLRVKSAIHNERFRVVQGRDDLCLYCPRAEHDHAECSMCPEGPDDAEDRDAFALELLDLEVGDVIHGTELEQRVYDALPRWRERVCSKCTWETTCATVMDLLSRA